MNKEELREKILNISNSYFPLIDFFNDVGKNEDIRFDKERTYEDIEKIYDVFMFYKEKCEKLEKVIEILKRFNFKVNETRHNSTGWEIWTDSLMEYEELTQEEYELLKEVLKNDI